MKQQKCLIGIVRELTRGGKYTTGKCRLCAAFSAVLFK